MKIQIEVYRDDGTLFERTSACLLAEAEAELARLGRHWDTQPVLMDEPDRLEDDNEGGNFDRPAFADDDEDESGEPLQSEREAYHSKF
jgi:hypothetical protein